MHLPSGHSDKLLSHLILAEFEAKLNVRDEFLVAYLQNHVAPFARGHTRLWMQLLALSLGKKADCPFEGELKSHFYG